MTLRNIHFLIYFLLEGFWKTGKNNNNNNFSTNTFLKIWLNPYMRSVGQIWSQNFNRAFFIRRSWIWHPKKLCKFEVIWQLVWQSMSSIVHSLENCPSIQYENVPLNPTLHGGPPPYQLWSLTAQTARLILVQSSYKFGHMGTNYGQDPKFTKTLIRKW